MTKTEILKAASGITGWMGEMELAWLIEQASTRRRVIEIGSWKGRSMKALALSVLEIAYAVDHWMEGSPPDEPRRMVDHDYREVVARGSGTIKAEFLSNLSQEIADGKCVPTGLSSAQSIPKLKELLAGRKVDMIFIDGDHEYAEVKRDIELYRPLLEEGGLLCGHDYPWPGVWKAAKDLVPKHRFLHDTTIWYATK